MKIIDIKISQLREYENNPRLNDGAVEAVANSIKAFGFKVPIVIDKNNVIINGHTRVKAATRLGMESVPALVADDLSDEQVKAFRLADNKVAEIAEWDLEKLNKELLALQDMDLGFSMADFDFDLSTLDDGEEIHEDNFNVDSELAKIENPKTKMGEVYVLGDHRLVCGDCNTASLRRSLMGSEMADAVVTDPPYNMNYSGSGGQLDKAQRKAKQILNDNMSEDKFRSFLKQSYRGLAECMKDGASFYIFYKELGAGVFISALRNTGLTFKQELIWVKSQLVLGGSKYQSIYEPMLFGCKGKRVAFWYSDRKQTSVIEDVNLMTDEELRETIKELLANQSTDIIRQKKQLINDLHPTMKPIRLLSKLIQNSSKKNDIVLDFFGGSGSTMIACEQTSRRCFMSELDLKYCDVIIKRWETFTGKIAIKEKSA